MASELRTGATATRMRKPPRAADDGGAASTTESSHRTKGTRQDKEPGYVQTYFRYYGRCVCVGKGGTHTGG